MSAGAQVSYTLTGAAAVKFTVSRLRRGRQVTLHGAFTQSGRSGRNSFRFTGRLAGLKLKPGGYRLIATPSAGGLAGSPAAAGFQIVAPKKPAG